MEENPVSLTVGLGPLLQSTVPLILDKDDDVRKSIISLMSYVAEHADEKRMIAFIPTLATYANSAMNHILNDIRIDSSRFLNLFLVKFAYYFRPYSFQIIPSSISILARKLTERDMVSTKALRTDANRIIILKNLNLLLEERDETADVTMKHQVFDVNAFTFEFPEDVLWMPFAERWSQRDQWKVDNVFGTSQVVKTRGFEMGLNQKGMETKGASTTTPQMIKDFLVSMIPVCFDIWLESAPSMFSGETIADSPALDKLNLVLETLKIVISGLQHNKLYSDVDSALQLFSKHVFEYFPFGHNAINLRGDNCERTLQKMKLTACEIITVRYGDIDASGAVDQSLNKVYEKAFGYLVTVLEKDKTKSGRTIEISPDNFKLISPVLTKVFEKSPLKSAKLLKVLCDKHQNLSVKSPVWSLMFVFIREIIVVRRLFPWKEMDDESRKAASGCAGDFKSNSATSEHVLSGQSWTPKLLSALISFGNMHSLDRELSTRLMDVIILRQQNLETMLSPETFFSFFLQFGVIGYTSPEMARLKSPNPDNTIAPLLSSMECRIGGSRKVNSDILDLQEVLARRGELSKKAIVSLKGRVNPSALVALFVSLGSQILQSATIPYDSFFGMANALSTLQDFAHEEIGAQVAFLHEFSQMKERFFNCCRQSHPDLLEVPSETVD
ncbi:Testis-expressed sequence 10 protein [Blyttiomyces sp. JEL0837]|nr:Testis-expressed sequence 10 protein [Blyttiomyces sp. JEL0837]